MVCLVQKMHCNIFYHGGRMTETRTAASDTTGILWDVTPQPSGTSLLKLSGDLKPGWLGKLSSYLSEEKINIIRGAGQKCGPLCWDTTFEIEKTNSSIDMHSGFNPLPALLASPRQVQIPAIRLTDLAIEPSTDHGGSIFAEISGTDCIGFLYGILRNFSFYSLFPTKFEISTRGSMAFDRFWLKGIGASTPVNEDMMALYDRLKTIPS